MIDPASREPLGELPPGEPGTPSAPASPQPRPASPERAGFAHASEAEMSRILDFYGVRWRYEPTTFPILWNLDGDVVESFSPDFYLPEFDLYLEMTTLKQSLVRKKNRKLRRLRELYPDIRIKLFYARDFRAMMLKYGRLGLAESLSGASGQLGGIPAGVPGTSPIHVARSASGLAEAVLTEAVLTQAALAEAHRSPAAEAARSTGSLATTTPGRRRTMRRTERGETTRGAGATVAKGEGESA